MSDTRERILDAAEELLRRHGPAKTNVVDVARHLGMSHANVYRHFASKAALQDAVAGRWLHRVSAPLAEIAARSGDAETRLRDWMTTLAATKRRKVTEDPEMFATYHALAEAARGVVDAHVAELQAHLARIVADGVRQGMFRVSNSEAAGRALLEATVSFHHPHFVRERPERPDALRQTLDLLLAGLRAGAL